jgi:hypothetical protein
VEIKQKFSLQGGDPPRESAPSAAVPSDAHVPKEIIGAVIQEAAATRPSCAPNLVRSGPCWRSNELPTLLGICIAGKEVVSAWTWMSKACVFLGTSAAEPGGDGGSMADSRQGGDDDDDGHKCVPSAQRRQHGVAAAHS